jgi:hypothetical protein
MTFLEILIFAIVVILFFKMMKPLRLRIEHYIYKTFKGKNNSKIKHHKDVPLNPNDYTTKEKKPNE